MARVRLGNLGETRDVGEGVHEMKIDYGPGYRLYFGNAGANVVLLLCGGDKSTQEADSRSPLPEILLYASKRLGYSLSGHTHNEP